MEISTSILNANNTKKSICELNETKTKYIHIDIMDGLFVKDKHFNNIDEINEIDKISKKKLDIHLMVENPIEYINKLNNMNIEFITIHLEINKNINEIINNIKKMGCKVGISIKPNTPIDKIYPYIDYIDLILIMSVEPGKGGQKFIETTPLKIIELKRIIKDKKIKIEVDGGINNKTLKKIRNVDIAVSGSYIINSNNYSKQINILLNNSKITIFDKIKDMLNN